MSEEYVKVRKCCLLCEHYVNYDDEFGEIEECSLHNEPVSAENYCDDFEINSNYLPLLPENKESNKFYKKEFKSIR